MLGFGLITVFWGNFGQSFFISWFGAAIQRELNLTATTYGLTYSAATVISGLSIMILGGLIDKIKIQHFVLLSSTGLFLAALFMSQVQSVSMLLLAFFMLRFFGQGLLPHTSGTAMSKYFSSNRGKALSISSNGVPLGEALLPAIAVALIAAIGWQHTWLVVAITVPLLFLPMALWLLKISGPAEAEQTTYSHTAAGQADGSRRTLLTDRRFWCALPLVLMPPFSVTGIFIHQGFILEQKHWSSTLFALTFTVYGVIHWCASFVTGPLIDRYSATRLFSFLGVPFAIGLILTGSLNHVYMAFVMMIMMGLGMSMMGSVVGSMWAEVYGTANLGSIRSLITSLIILSTSASPILLGFLIDHGMTANQLLTALGTYALISTILSLFSYHRRIAIPRR
ncbi:arabinose efflux permease [Gynuella sunshinyii YC6258]|uniref:Arabinose efflux permease n=2 Tax=Gynuella sunshinyii TaxID=1445505 RepID=A0A0C5VRI0_9GAMM|nr:arabinose efflux permease [Gynuella sunshinyii YC6258]